MRAAALSLSLSLSLSAAASRAQDRAGAVPRAGFVGVRDGHLALDGARFRFVGANASIMHGAPHRAAAEAVLDAAAADGLRVVRIWALGEHPAGADPWTRDYAFRVGPEGWVEGSFAHLDRVLAAARARDLRAVVVLANRWSDYGGAARYLEWAGLSVPGATPLRPDEALARFFDESSARALYHAHVRRVIARVNTVTGVAYRDDPTVLAWELINESDIDPRRRDVLVRWTQETARMIRAADPSHLIAAGHIGYTRASQRETWLALQRLPEVDYADAHAYPGQLRAIATPADLDDLVDDHAQLARHVLRKPFVWGEFGFGTNARALRGVPRARWYERFLARSEMDDVDGAMVWIYSPSADPPREHGVFVDAPRATRTRDVRAVLSRFASRWRTGVSATNPRLEPSRGEAPLWSTRRAVAGPGAVMSLTRAGTAVAWSVSPERYATFTAENVGRWDGFAVWHVYGSGDAEVTYRLRVTAGARAAGAGATRVTLRARVSSELPGRGEGAAPEDVSRVGAYLDDVSMGEFVAPLDDGAGRWVELTTEDPRVISRLRAVGSHALRLAVVPGERANGLCVYGAATGREAVPAGSGALPGRVSITLGR